MNVGTNLRTWISVTRSVSGTGTDFEDQRLLVGTCGHCLICMFFLFFYFVVHFGFLCYYDFEHMEE